MVEYQSPRSSAWASGKAKVLSTTSTTKQFLIPMASSLQQASLVIGSSVTHWAVPKLARTSLLRRLGCGIWSQPIAWLAQRRPSRQPTPQTPEPPTFLQPWQSSDLSSFKTQSSHYADHPNHPLYVRHPLFMNQIFMAYFTDVFSPAVRSANEVSENTYRVRCLPLADQVALRMDEKLDRLQLITSTPTKQPIPPPQPSLVSPKAKQLAEQQFRLKFDQKQLFIWPQSIQNLDTLEQVFFHGSGDQPAFKDYVDEQGNLDSRRAGWQNPDNSTMKVSLRPLQAALPLPS